MYLIKGSWDEIILDLGWTLNSMTGILKRERRGPETHRHTGRRPKGRHAETEVMLPQAKGNQKMREASMNYS